MVNFTLEVGMTVGFTRREREREMHRLEILEGAKRLFARKGFAAATMDEIAEEAEFSKGAIYTYFPSKEQLFLSLMEEKIGKLFGEENEIIALAINPKDKIERLIEIHLAFFEKDKEFFQIIHSERFRLEKEMIHKLHAEMKQKFIGYLDLISKVMQEGISNKLLRNMDPRTLASALMGMLNSFTMQWILQGGKGSLAAMKSIILELFFRGAELKD
jgi:AcrR family transcriptional regulator